MITERRDRYGVAYISTSCRISGGTKIDTFRAMCLLAGRYQPHELVAQIVADAITNASQDPDVRRLVELLPTRREAHLRVIEGGAS